MQPEPDLDHNEAPKHKKLGPLDFLNNFQQLNLGHPNFKKIEVKNLGNLKISSKLR